MQKQTQTEKVFAKNKRISTIYNKGRKTNSKAWAWFEQRERGKSDDQLRDLILDIIDSISDDSTVLTIEEECHKRNIHSRTLRKWAKQCQIVDDGKDFALEILGVRREKGWLNKKLNDKSVLTFWQFLDRYKEHDDREDTRKIKLANEGVAEGQTIIRVVNENIKEEVPA